MTNENRAQERNLIIDVSRAPCPADVFLTDPEMRLFCPSEHKRCLSLFCYCIRIVSDHILIYLYHFSLPSRSPISKYDSNICLFQMEFSCFRFPVKVLFLLHAAKTKKLSAYMFSIYLVSFSEILPAISRNLLKAAAIRSVQALSHRANQDKQGKGLVWVPAQCPLKNPLHKLLDQS